MLNASLKKYVFNLDLKVVSLYFLTHQIGDGINRTTYGHHIGLHFPRKRTLATNLHDVGAKCPAGANASASMLI